MDQSNLTRSTGRALTWSYTGSLVRLLLGFSVNILLARLLGPRPFGEIAVAMLLFGFGNLLGSIGVTTALIQKANLTERDTRFCFTAQMIVGTFVAAVLFVSAPAWSVFFHDFELTPLLRALAPIFIFQSLGTTASALLSRAQNTRAIQIASVTSYVVAFVGLAAPLALMGYGVWSLVTAYLCQALVSSVVLFVHAPHPLIPLMSRDGMPLLHFGVYVLAANICNWGISNLDNAVVGRVAGPAALGLYSRAFVLALTPVELIVTNLQQVILPAFSRAQDDRSRLARGYLAVFGLVGLILFPVFSAMAVVPNLVMVGLFGTKWAAAAPFFRPLALALPIHGLMALAGPTLASRGKPRIELSLQFPILLIVLSAFVLSIKVSVLCLSWTVLGVYLLRCFLLTRAVLRELDIAWSRIFRVVSPSLAAAAVSGTSACLMEACLRALFAPVQLAIVSFSVAVVTGLSIIVGSRFFLSPILRNSPQIEDFLHSKLGPLYFAERIEQSVADRALNRHSNEIR